MLVRNINSYGNLFVGIVKASILIIFFNERFFTYYVPNRSFDKQRVGVGVSTVKTRTNLSSSLSFGWILELSGVVLVQNNL